MAREQPVRDVGPAAPTDTVSRIAVPVGFRGDVEGLRAVAVLLVLASHAGLPLTGGYVGVDVFFVISGFLITSLLLGELATTGTISLREFYARRARRLLPAVAVVLGVTGLLTLVLLPRTRWLDVGYDMLASALYVQNWRLAGAAVDYQAQDAAVSPLQHFWSLGVEEQFYLLWPLLLLGVVALLRTRRGGHLRGPLTQASPRTRRRAVLLVAGVMVLTAVGSFVWSVYATAGNPAGAYFVTTTRLWELAAGGLVALAAGRIATVPRIAGAAMSWAGLAAIALAAVLYSGSTPFPGFAALLPVLGTAAVLAGGATAGRSGAGRLLDTAGMRWIGGLSYSLYLWHWPLLAIAFAVAGERSTVLGLAVVVVSFVPAYLSFRLVEDPVRRDAWLRRDPGRSLVAGGAYTAVGVIASFVVIATVWPPPSVTTSLPYDASAASAPGAPVVKRGAMVLADDPRDDPAGAPVDSVASISPDPGSARSDTGAGFCSTPILGVEVRSCVTGDTYSTTNVALVGDSHAQQWTNPLSSVAKDRGWRLTGYTKSGCPFLLQDVAISVDEQGARAATRPYTECAQWRDEVIARLTGPDRPAMIIVSSGEHQAVRDGEVLGGQASVDLQAQGYRDVWKRFTDLGTKVVVIADTPAPDTIVPDCVADNPDSLTACTFDRAASNRADGASLVDAARSVPGVTLIDLSDAVCPTERCAPVIGGVLVWRDNSHLSATYATTLAPRLDTALPTLP